jgi:hypothetical protein
VQLKGEIGWLTVLSTAMKKKMNEMYVRFQARSDTPAGSDPYR